MSAFREKERIVAELQANPLPRSVPVNAATGLSSNPFLHKQQLIDIHPYTCFLRRFWARCLLQLVQWIDQPVFTPRTMKDSRTAGFCDLPYSWRQHRISNWKDKKSLVNVPKSFDTQIGVLTQHRLVHPIYWAVYLRTLEWLCYCMGQQTEWIFEPIWGVQEHQMTLAESSKLLSFHQFEVVEILYICTYRKT